MHRGTRLHNQMLSSCVTGIRPTQLSQSNTCALLLIGVAHAFGAVGHVQQAFTHTLMSSFTFHVVFMHQLCGSSPECNHPSLHTHSFQLGPIEVISASGQLLKVHVRADIHLSGMYSQDVCPRFLSGQWKFNLAVQTTWIRKKMEVPCSKCMCMTDTITCGSLG